MAPVKKVTPLKQGLSVGLGAFFLALVVNLGSQGLFSQINALFLALLLLVGIILMGVLFDIIGVAATAASEGPLHARAAKRMRGASQAIKLVRNADRVASFCNDVVGDISGTLSGALGASVAMVIMGGRPSLWVATILTAAIAGLTIGGKAAGKGLALRYPEEIVFRVGQVMAWLEQNLHLRLLGDDKGGRK